VRDPDLDLLRPEIEDRRAAAIGGNGVDQESTAGAPGRGLASGARLRDGPGQGK
jgi:hypothetical protein